MYALFEYWVCFQLQTKLTKTECLFSFELTFSHSVVHPVLGANSAFPIVLVHSGCYNTNTVREAEKPKIKVLADSVSGDAHFLTDSARLTVTSHGGRGEHILLGFFYRDTNSTHPVPFF
jgi:hypothetical protein